MSLQAAQEGINPSPKVQELRELQEVFAPEQNSLPWRQRVGNQRDWVWRGWRIRYTYWRSPLPNATPILLLHGFGASIGHWRHNFAALAENHTVYALDLLGFGGSAKAAISYDTNLWVELVFEFWLTFIRQPTILMGNSIGSLVCVGVAGTHPEMVQGVVMINLPDFSVREEMLPPWLQPVVRSIENLFTSPLLIKPLFYLLRRPAIVKKWAGMAYYNPEAITEELVEILSSPALDQGSATTFAALFRGMSSTSFAPSIKSILPQLTMPLLLIWGRHDRMIPPNLANRFAAMNPALEIVALDAGHCPHDECPEVVNLILCQWLSRLQEK